MPPQHHALFIQELHQSQSLMALMDSTALLHFLTDSKPLKDSFLNPSRNIYVQNTAFIFFKHLMMEPLKDSVHENISYLLNHFIKQMQIEAPLLLSDSEKFKLIKNILILQDFIAHKRHKTDIAYRWFKSTTRQEEIEAATQIIAQLKHPQQINIYIMQSHLNVLKGCRIYESLELDFLSPLMQTKKISGLF